MARNPPSDNRSKRGKSHRKQMNGIATHKGQKTYINLNIQRSGICNGCIFVDKQYYFYTILGPSRPNTLVRGPLNIWSYEIIILIQNLALFKIGLATNLGPTQHYEIGCNIKPAYKLGSVEHYMALRYLLVNYLGPLHH